MHRLDSFGCSALLHHLAIPPHRKTDGDSREILVEKINPVLQKVFPGAKTGEILFNLEIPMERVVRKEVTFREIYLAANSYISRFKPKLLPQFNESAWKTTHEEINRIESSVTRNFVRSPSETTLLQWCFKGYALPITALAWRERERRGNGIVIGAGLEPWSGISNTEKLVPSMCFVTRRELEFLQQQLGMSARPNLEWILGKHPTRAIAEAIALIDKTDWEKQIPFYFVFNKDIYGFHSNHPRNPRETMSYLRLVAPEGLLSDEICRIILPLGEGNQDLRIIFHCNTVFSRDDLSRRVYLFKKRSQGLGFGKIAGGKTKSH